MGRRQDSRRIGIHVPSQGSLAKTAERAHELGANTFQIFSASPRMWRAAMPDPADARAMRRVRERYDLAPLAIHDNYLINLASVDPVVRAKSVEAFRAELERARAIGAEYLVAHPGSYRGQTLEQGIVSFVEGLAEAAKGFAAPQLTLLLEGTAGQGSAIGARLEELAAIREMAAGKLEFGLAYCLDTCHLLAAGYDVASVAGLKRTVAEAQRVLGMENVRVVHANDSQGALRSRKDRHANIGKGHIGREGFARILAHPKLRRVPFILETPVEEEGDDRKDLETLKELCPKKRTITGKSN